MAHENSYANMSRADLSALYQAKIGYCPFEDDPEATVAEVAKTLAEWDAEAVASGLCQAFVVGEVVRIKPQYAEGDVTVYRVVTPDEGKGRVDISPVSWDYATQGAVRPMELVGVEMIEKVQL